MHKLVNGIKAKKSTWVQPDMEYHGFDVSQGIRLFMHS